MRPHPRPAPDRTAPPVHALSEPCPRGDSAAFDLPPSLERLIDLLAPGR